MPVIHVGGDDVATGMIARRVKPDDPVKVEHALVVDVYEGEVVAEVLDIEPGRLSEAGRLPDVTQTHPAERLWLRAPPRGMHGRLLAGDGVLACDQPLPVRPSAQLEPIGGRVAASVPAQVHVHDGARWVGVDQLDVDDRDVVVVPEPDVVVVGASFAVLELRGQLRPRARVVAGGDGVVVATNE